MKNLKKLNVGKLSLDELRQVGTVLSAKEQEAFVGGSDSLRIAGGYLIHVNGGTLFCGDDNSSVWFPGVDISTSWVSKDSAYQINGTIHMDQNWLNSGFSVYDFAHEYGHFLQQHEMGNLDYIINIGAPSAYNDWTDRDSHGEQWYEQDATNRGYNYLNSNWLY